MNNVVDSGEERIPAEPQVLNGDMKGSEINANFHCDPAENDDIQPAIAQRNG